MAVGVIIGVVFLSQQPFFTTNNTRYVYSEGASSIGKTLENAVGWVKNSVPKKVGDAVDGGVTQTNSTLDGAKTELENKKNNFLKNTFDNTREFIAKKTLDVLGVTPQDLGSSCPAS